MDMVSEAFIKFGPELVKDGRVDQRLVDAACRRILEAKYKLGLFDDPYRFISNERNQHEMMTADKLELAKQAACESMVLLKNANSVLPLRPGQRIAFVGPLVKDQRNLIGAWSGAGDWKQAESIWLKELKGFQRVSLAAGEPKKVTFSLSSDDLSFYNSELKRVVEPGEFEVFCGDSSDTTNSAKFTYSL